MNYLALIFGWLVFSLSAKGQEHVIDSLKNLLPAAKQDTQHFRVLRLISVLYDESNSDSSIEYEQRALRLAKRLNFKGGEIRSISHLGFLAMTKGNYSTALDLLIQAKEYNNVDAVNPLSVVINQNLGL